MKEGTYRHGARGYWVGALAMAVLGTSLTACEDRRNPVAPADFSTQIVGHWRGTVGDERETMSINSDGTFSCQLRERGFIANMLDPRKPGTISGTWKITGNVVTLTITAEKSERSANSVTASAIVSFNENEVVLQSDRGEKSSFARVAN